MTISTVSAAIRQEIRRMPATAPRKRLSGSSVTCRDYFKKLYRDRELEQAQLARPAGQERDFTENCGQSSLLQALSRLPGVQREALTLYYFDELKIREIARITGTNTATVKSRLHQGKQKLKKILEEETQ